MTITVTKYANRKAELGVAKVQIDTTLYEFRNIVLFQKYTKKNVASAQLIDALSVRTNNVSATHNVAGQGVNTSALYVSGALALTDLNYPSSPSVATLVTPLTTLTSTPANVPGGGSGKTRVIGIINTDTANARTVRLTINGDNYNITITAGKGLGILLVDTPTTDQISLADPGNTGKLQYFVVEGNTANANTDSYTRTITVKDSAGNTIDTGSATGTFMWVFYGIGTVPEESVIGGGAFQP
jgi:hypothetical protein